MKTFQKHIFGLMAICYGFSLVYQFVLVTNYQINKIEITEAFCENKDKPELECHGKCHLKKQLQQINSAPEDNIDVFAPNFNLLLLSVFEEIKFSQPQYIIEELCSIHFETPDYYKGINLNNSSPPPKA